MKERLSLVQGDLSDREVRNKEKELLLALFYNKHTSKMSSRFCISFVSVSHRFLHQH